MNYRRDNAFLLTALAAPLVQISGSCNWLTVILITAVGIAAAIAWGCLASGVPPKWLAALQWVWFAVEAAFFAAWVTACWPEQQGFPVIPGVLLALAAMVSTGKARGGRACAVLLCFMVGLFGAVLFAGVKDVELRWLAPKTPEWEPALALILVLPLCRIPARGEKGKNWSLLAVPVFACCVSLLCSGVLSPVVAREADFAFYETSRSLSLFGVIERFESVAAAAMTLGYFCTLSYIMSFAAEAAEILYPGMNKWGGRLCAVLAFFLMLLPFEYLPEGLVLLGLALFVLLPAGVYFYGKIKVKKEEKSP